MREQEEFKPFPERGYVSHSSISLFKQCQRKWAWRYIYNLDEGTTPARTMGKAWSHALDAEYSAAGQGINAIDTMYEAEMMSAHDQSAVDTLESQRTTLHALLTGYIRKYDMVENMQGWVRELEYNLPIPTVDGITSKGYIDGAHHTREILVEDKLLTPMWWGQSSVEALDLDEQVTEYFWAMPWAKTMEYRVTMKPGIKRRTMRQPESPGEFAKRVVDDINERPDFYFRDYLLTRTEQQIAEHEEDKIHTITQMLECVRLGVYPKTTRACSEYGGCPRINDCLSVAT